MSTQLSLETTRLRLVAADARLVRMELSDRQALVAALNCTMPSDWPPPLNDDASFTYFLDEMERDPSMAGWGFWYVIERQSNEAIGICGVKGRPNASGTAEIGYSIIPARQGLGFATEAVAGLIGWCRSRGILSVVAETLPELAASIRVMEKNGLVFDGEGSEPGIIRYRRSLLEGP